ncbi:MAG: nucleotide sugar dehydrogenase, partial [Gammaproteobacteria bacterium]
ICIVGLGYVGLPLAARFSLKGFDVIGFDINKDRVDQLNNNFDANNDVSKKDLETLGKYSKLTSNVDDIKDCNIYIVTVPTPINQDKTPDLKPLIASSKLVGSVIKKGSIIVFESTVYPGVTDDVCTPILIEKSGLNFNKEFSTGYSPERIVPGDKVNTIEKIKKVVSASNEQALRIISFLYSSIIDAGIFEASSIKVAEAAKVTENIQRDVNIALINEFHQLYSSIGIDTNAVIDAASTKWNFMKLNPGLVGGHCISIDPYYLMHKSETSGYKPNIMHAARKLNDEMGLWVVKSFIDFLEKENINTNKVTILGYTFKENCSDTRNTKVRDLIAILKQHKFKISLWDPLISNKTKSKLKDLGLVIHENEPRYDEVVMVCVYHSQILEFITKFKGKIFDYRKII